MDFGGLPWHISSTDFEFCTRRCGGDWWGHVWWNLRSRWSPPPVPRVTGRQRSRWLFWCPHRGRQFWSTTISIDHLGRLLVQVFQRQMCVHWYLCLFYPGGGGRCLLTRRWWRGQGQSHSGRAGGSHAGLSMRWCIRRNRILQVVLRGGQKCWLSTFFPSWWRGRPWRWTRRRISGKFCLVCIYLLLMNIAKHRITHC